MRIISGSEREEVTGGWKKLHNLELQIYAVLQILFE
jgi:hypothetical protein